MKLAKVILFASNVLLSVCRPSSSTGSSRKTSRHDCTTVTPSHPLINIGLVVYTYQILAIAVGVVAGLVLQFGADLSQVIDT